MYSTETSFRIMDKSPKVCITQIFQKKQYTSEIHWNSLFLSVANF